MCQNTAGPPPSRLHALAQSHEVQICFSYCADPSLLPFSPERCIITVRMSSCSDPSASHPSTLTLSTESRLHNRQQVDRGRYSSQLPELRSGAITLSWCKIWFSVARAIHENSFVPAASVMLLVTRPWVERLNFAVQVAVGCYANPDF